MKNFFAMLIAASMMLAIGGASGSDILHVYGNANLDSTIDQKDIGGFRITMH
jgi:hypothetical protein